MNICILGAGAIGSLWACYLNNAGHTVSLWTRGSESSLSLSLDQQPAIVFPCNQETQLASADLLIVTVKAWQVQSALLPITSLLKPDCSIVFSHNGMGAVEAVLGQIFEHPAFFATTTHGALRKNKQQVLHTGQGQTIIGPLNNKAEAGLDHLVQTFNLALPPAQADRNIYQALWNKLAINCCINPLTALKGCRNGQLAARDTLEIIEILCIEISAVINAEGFSCDNTELFARTKQVIEATSENFSSMHQDIHNNRPTEIDYITGYLLERARAHDIDTPMNENLFEQIKQKEAKNDH
ncbi:2-dehydropantoate 2-reductase [Vibrio superstes]|uniref:2-dehydropantoate 2-reductase n=1 Tax=Vibrio superstes NBRC 103154 TaxID=1219062 RepID=A0A511QUG8_9VIBR|nr:2-dehydropantoate 2-reductase [Vibrio superstes]GEM80192.1 2-dehydropantoate 2-reductase [Vibrio superstes NBRC 103154]